jgi:hypothetical protein
MPEGEDDDWRRYLLYRMEYGNSRFREDMDRKNEEEAKGLPKINHERAIEIAANTIKNVLKSFYTLDRINIVQNVLDLCTPFGNDSAAFQALKNVYLDCHRIDQLYYEEDRKALDEFYTRSEFIDE